MPKLNPYLIKENYKQVEEVREINNEVPSFEEFMKTYESDGRVIESYENEFKSYGDIGVAKGYGPCFECSNSAKFRLEINLTSHWMTGASNTAICYRATRKFIFNGVEQVRENLDEFENGSWRVVNWAGIETDNARSQKNYIIRRLRYYIRRHESGADVDDTIEQIT